MALVAVPVNILHIVLFSMDTPQSIIEHTWRNGIVISHAVLAVIFVLLGLIAFLIKDNINIPTVRQAVVLIATITTLSMGVVIVSIDQLVTASITPFMVGCIITALVFLLRPPVSVLLFGLAFIAYVVAISFTQVDQAILLSNRVNGLTVVGLSLFLSIFLWRSTTNGMRHKHIIAVQQKELEQKNHELEFLAFFDKLTGVFNRHRFEELLRLAFSSDADVNRSFALLMVDIDHFKLYNDTYGHLAGDECLRRVATTVDAIAQREGGKTGRFGGEEFLVLLHDITENEALQVAETMRCDIERLCIENRGAGTCLTISVGVAVCDNLPTNPEELIHAADSALYAAKEQGRNRVALHGALH